MIYSLGGLAFCLVTWLNVWEHADIIRIANRPELILSTVASAVGIFTSLIGQAGTLLNNRRFLALYTFLTWVSLACLFGPGYVAVRRRGYDLDGKLDLQWSRGINLAERGRIQNELKCCGYYDTFVEATVTQTCYSRSMLPGCKLKFLKFERKILWQWSIVVFRVVPLHIGVMVSALLCSNHVTYRFGKGMMPKRYRLTVDSLAVIMDNYAKYVVFNILWGHNLCAEC